MEHANNCIRSNLNILSIYDGTYNICRNLEWMICGARGRLPGQWSDKVIFSHAPNTLEPLGEKFGQERHHFGRCSGFRQEEFGSCDGGYATDDIFFLEVCIYNQICTNGDELFDLKVGQKWRCELDERRFKELEGWLTEPLDLEHATSYRGETGRCEKWCNEWNCRSEECRGCPRELKLRHNCGAASPSTPPPPPPSSVRKRVRRHHPPPPPRNRV